MRIYIHLIYLCPINYIICTHTCINETFLVAQIRNLSAMQRLRFDSWVRKIPWRRKWLHTSVFLPGEFHGQRSLAGYSPWGCKELEMTERLTDARHTYMHTYIYIHMHTYMHIHMHTHIYTYTHIHTCTYMCILTYTCIHAYTCILTYTCIHTHAYTHIQTCTYTCIHTYTHTHTYTRIQTYTHMHIYMHKHIYMYIHIYIYIGYRKINSGGHLRLPGSSKSKESAFEAGEQWRRKWQPTPVFLPGESHGQRSLAGYSIFIIFLHSRCLGKRREFSLDSWWSDGITYCTGKIK